MHESNPKTGSLSLPIIIDSATICPTQKETKLCNLNENDSNIQVSIIELNSLLVKIDEVSFISQPINFEKLGYAIIVINWNFRNDSKIKVSINQQQIEELTSTKAVKSISPLNIDRRLFSAPVKTKSNHCFDHWIEWRSENLLGSKIKRKQDRIPKPIDEQILDLYKSLESINRLIENHKTDERLFLIACLPFLRSLLFWRENNPNYNPLLLRLAAHRNMKLPVYALSNRENEQKNRPPFFEDISFCIYNFAFFKQKSPFLNMMDLQEWLVTDLVFVKHNNGIQSYTMQEVLGLAANTNSGTHFDTEIPVIIHRLIHNLHFDQSQLYQLIFNLSILTLNIGSLVLQENGFKQDHKTT